MSKTIVSFMVAAAGLVAAANADLAFSFADPTGGRQLTNTQANQAGPGTGVMSYDQTAVLGLFIDGSTEPNPFNFLFANARMEMSMTVFTGTTTFGLFNAPVLGFFRIYDATTGDTIIRGDATGGAFIRFGGTSSILLSSDTGFMYTFGTALNNLLTATGNTNRFPIDPQEAVFTITDAVTATGAPIVNTVSGVVNSFAANTSYSGNTTVPTPGAMALLGVGSLMAGRRRR
ncbi:hypothetical protein BH11PLA1_BH11PLA1_18570 [soil metagenome]